MRARFLSEYEAATYIGMSAAQLAGLRKFDLAMIEKGFKPHGPPPLWQGADCSYASETLDEWIRAQSDARAKQRQQDRRNSTSQQRQGGVIAPPRALAPG